MQKRAKSGGELGANGEHYGGGKFIATTNHPKGTPQKGGPRMALIAPWTLVAAREGWLPVFGLISGLEIIIDGVATLNPDYCGDRRESKPMAERLTDIAAWNDGFRWFRRGSNPREFSK